MVIKIGHVNYKVKFLPKIKMEGHLLNGYIDYNKEEILICSKYPKKKIETLLHEVIHGVGEFSCLNLTERQVTGLATGLMAVFRDNKKFLSSIK